jgi:hypothetical protein
VATFVLADEGDEKRSFTLRIPITGSPKFVVEFNPPASAPTLSAFRDITKSLAVHLGLKRLPSMLIARTGNGHVNIRNVPNDRRNEAFGRLADLLGGTLVEGKEQIYDGF